MAAILDFRSARKHKLGQGRCDLTYLRAFMVGAASQAGDADSSRAPGLTSGLQGSLNVHRGALLLVPQWRCISSFVFYIPVKYS